MHLTYTNIVQIQHIVDFLVFLTILAILALSHAFGQSHAKCPYSPQLKNLIFDKSLCPFPLWSPLILCFFFVLIFAF